VQGLTRRKIDVSRNNTGSMCMCTGIQRGTHIHDLKQKGSGRRTHLLCPTYFCFYLVMSIILRVSLLETQFGSTLSAIYMTAKATHERLVLVLGIEASRNSSSYPHHHRSTCRDFLIPLSLFKSFQRASSEMQLAWTL